MEPESTPQQELRQIQTNPIPDNYLQWLQDYEKELDELYHHLLGERRVKMPMYHGKGEDKQVVGFYEDWHKDRDPIMKENGAHFIISFLRGCALMKVNVMSYIEEWRIMKILRANMLAYRKTLRQRGQCAVPLPPHCRTCGHILRKYNTICSKCDEERVEMICRGHPDDCDCYNLNVWEEHAVEQIIDNLLELALRSSLQGKYLQLVSKTYGVGETRQIGSVYGQGQQQQGLWGKLRFW